MLHKGQFRFYDRKPQQPDPLQDVIAGFQKCPKQISPKYFYDEEGSRLFDAITQLQEYYPTRTEVKILSQCNREIAEIVGTGCCLIEYGSGSSTKVRLLLDALAPSYYIPVDISKSHLKAAALSIHQDYEELTVLPTCADYTLPFELPEEIEGTMKCGFFPGSSIGNFERDAASRFLTYIHDEVGTGGYVILGVDKRKSKSKLELAYNDTRGITAQFNKNLLNHLNSLIGSDFDPNCFKHHAFYDEQIGRIEMHLVSQVRQEIALGDQIFALEQDESIHTENSYKYSIHEIESMASTGNMECVKTWEDEEGLFVVALLQAL